MYIYKGQSSRVVSKNIGWVNLCITRKRSERQQEMLGSSSIYLVYLALNEREQKKRVMVQPIDKSQQSNRARQKKRVTVYTVVNTSSYYREAAVVPAAVYNRDKTQGANRVTGIIVNRERETLNMDGNITIYVVGGLQGTRNTHIRKDDVEKGITIMKSEVNIMEPPQQPQLQSSQKEEEKK